MIASPEELNVLPKGPEFTPSAVTRLRKPNQSLRAFSLVEVTIALGLVSYALLALMGLFTVGLTSSRDSSVETALSQIALHAASKYSSSTNVSYNYSGIPSQGTAEDYFAVMVSTNKNAVIANTSSNLRMLTVSITTPNNPGITNVIQTAVFIP